MAVAKLVAADKGHNVAALRFHGGNGPLHQRILLQAQMDRGILFDRSGIKRNGFLLFAALGVGFRNRDFFCGNPDNIANRHHLAGVFDGWRVGSRNLGVGLARPGHGRNRHNARISLAQRHFDFLGIHGGHKGLHPVTACQIKGRKLVFRQKFLLFCRVKLLHRAAPALALVQFFQPTAQGRASRSLMCRIHGGLHCQACFVHVIRAVLGGFHPQCAEV